MTALNITPCQIENLPEELPLDQVLFYKFYNSAKKNV